MDALLTSLIQLFESLWGVFTAVVMLALPWAPLFAWIAFWLFAVNWVKLREIVLAGGWAGIVLVGIAAVLIWGTAAPPVDGTHSLLGLSVSNYVGKTVYVTALIAIAFLCGSVQLSGALPACCRVSEEDAADDAGHAH